MNRRLAVALMLIVATDAPRAWSGSGAATNPATAEARRAVETFCEADFQAHPTRDSLATFSPAVRKAHKQDQDAGWPLVNWMWDPLTVAVAYRVGDVVANDSTGSATVEFDEIARSPGKQQRFVRLPRRVSSVTLSLRKRGGAWRVEDPPEPRVSLGVLVGIYSYQLARVDEDWFRGASVNQVAWYQRDVEVMKFLKNLN